MNASRWSYPIRASLRGIRQNGVMSVASVSTLAISLLVLAVFLVLAVNLQYMAHVLDAQVEIVAYLRSDFDRANEGLLLQQVHSLAGVSQVTFVTKEQALARLKRQFGDQQDLLAAVEDHNPLPDTLEVRVTSPSVIASVAARVARLPGVDKADYRQQVVEKLFAFTRALRTVGLVLTLGLAFATVMVLANTTRLAVHARREEIGIMKLVGATDGFIRGPFLLEGAILGVIGAAVAAGLVWWGYSWTVRQVAFALPFVPILPRQPLMLDTTGELLLFGLALGSLGSAWSVRRYLRV